MARKTGQVPQDLGPRASKRLPHLEPRAVLSNFFRFVAETLTKTRD